MLIGFNMITGLGSRFMVVKTALKKSIAARGIKHWEIFVNSKISDQQQSWGFEEGPSKGPAGGR